jgi:hypothetical protein
VSIAYWGRRRSLLVRGRCEWLRASLCAGVFAACGGAVEAGDPGDDDAGHVFDSGRRDTGVEARAGSAGSGGSSGRGGSSGSGRGGTGLRGAVDPTCPDASPPEPIYECDPVAPAPGGCPSGQACYFDTEYGGSPCAPNRVIARCGPAGTGTQDAPCGGDSECAGDFLCTGVPFVCSRRCRPGEPCDDGLICEGVVGIPKLGTCK